MPRLLVDTTPLRRYPDFRRVWLGFAFSSFGTQLGVVAIAYEVFKITRSSLDVGLISLVQLGPSLVGSITGGSIADAMDRRKLLVFSGIAMSACAAGMALHAQGPHPSLWVFFVLAALSAGVAGINGPAMVAVMISIVEREAMVSANALRQLLTQVSAVLGPSLGGLLLAAFNIRVAFWANALFYVLGTVVVLTVHAHPPVGGATRFGLRSIAEGFHFLKGRQPIQGCFVADLNATILGMPTALFPALGLVYFHGGSRAVGFLYAAPGFGALIASVLSGWTLRVHRPGRAVCIAIVVWGVALAGFGLAPWFPLALGLLAVAGGADVISAVFRSTIIQTEAPDRLRGRLSSIQLAVVQAGPRLGNAEAGLVAAASTTQISVVSGGIGCVIGIAIVARLMPRFLHYVLPKVASHEGATEEAIAEIEAVRPAPA